MNLFKRRVIETDTAVLTIKADETQLEVNETLDETEPTADDIMLIGYVIAGVPIAFVVLLILTAMIQAPI